MAFYMQSALMLMCHAVEISKLAAETLDTLLLDLLDKLSYLRGDDVLVKAEILVCVPAGQRLAKGGHGVTSISIALPTIDSICLDDYSRSVGAVLEDLTFVFQGLRIEESLTRERNNAGFDAELLFQDLAGLDGKDHFGTNTNEGDVGILLFYEDLRVVLAVGVDQVPPIFNETVATSLAVAEKAVNLIRYHVVLLRIHTKALFDSLDTIGSESSAVGLSITSNLATDTDDSVDVNEGRFVRACLGLEKSLDDTLDVETAILDLNHMPATSTHLGIDVLGVAEIDTTITGDLVVIVHDDEVVKLPMASQLNSLESDTFLQTGVTNHAVSHVVDEVEVGLVVSSRKVLGSHGETDSIGNTLTQRTGRHLNAFMLNLGMAWCQ
ncbi:hypothetical protein HG530_001088 [Fusarium avenaceum]|nr:hypothetical protein HG530_001088 [Fusarium avenaceum]